MAVSTRPLSHRPHALTVTIGGTRHRVRAHRIHPVGEVVSGGETAGGAVREGLATLDFGTDVCDMPESLMRQPPGRFKRRRLVTSRACCYRAARG